MKPIHDAKTKLAEYYQTSKAQNLHLNFQQMYFKFALHPLEFINYIFVLVQSWILALH